MLKRESYFSIHRRNIQSLAIASNNISNRIMCDIFENKNLSYNLRSHTDLMRASVNKSNFRTNSLKSLATKICEKGPGIIVW